MEKVSSQRDSFDKQENIVNSETKLLDRANQELLKKQPILNGPIIVFILEVRRF